MADLGWIKEIIDDLEYFARLNDLDETTEALEQAGEAIVFELEYRHACEQLNALNKRVANSGDLQEPKPEGPPPQ